MASRYCIPMHLSSWAPRAKILPSYGVRKAENGGCTHLEGSAGTESMWELRRMEGREGFDPGQVRSSTGLLGVNSSVWIWRSRFWAWDLRKETAEA